MATPERIYRIYERLYQDADQVRDFQVARGDKVSGTVTLLLGGDRDHLLQRWAEEMHEICGVLMGTHRDPFILEATQVFYWASLYAVTAGVSWADLAFYDLRQQAAASRIESPDYLASQATRLAGLGADTAKPGKLFMLWWVAYQLYCAGKDVDERWSVEQIMEADLQEMKKRVYLRPILDAVG